MGGYDIGPKIGITGEAEYRSQLNAIITTQRTLKTEMGAVASAFDKGTKSMDALKATGGVLEKQVAAQREKLELVKRALQEAAEKYGEADTRTQKWQQVVNKATEELNNLERELRQNREAIDNFDDSMAEADGALNDFGDAASRAGEKSLSFGDIVKANVISDAIISGVRALADAFVEAGKAMVSFAMDGAAYADNVLTMSQVTGVSTEKLQEYSYAAELIDVSVDTLTSSMSRNISAMQSAAEGSASYASAYEKLGVSVTDASGNLRDSEAVYWEVIDALGEMSNETERDALVMDLMGRSAQDLNPLIEAGASRMAELGEEAHRAGAVLGDETLANFGELDDSLQRLSLSSDAAKNAVGAALAPALESAASSATDVLSAITTTLNETGDFAAAAEAGMQVAQPLIQGFIDSAIAMAPTLAEMGTQLIGSLLTGLLSNADSLVSVVLDGVLFPLLDLFLSNLPLLLEVGMEILLSLARGIIDALPQLIPTVIQVTIELAMYLIAYGVPQLIACAPELIGALIEGLLSGVGLLISMAPELILALAEGMLSAIGSILDIGVQIVEGIWQGISSGLGWIKEKISGWVGDVLEFFKGLLGIHSPSTVFADEIGIMMAEGVGVGFVAGLGDVSKDMEKAQQELNGKMSSMAMALETSQTLNVGTQTVVHHHTGTVRIEGVSDEGDFIGAADVVYADLVAELKKEART